MCFSYLHPLLLTVSPRVNAEATLGVVQAPLLERAGSLSEADRMFVARYMLGDVVACSAFPM